jgi:hypothetical protein
VTGGKPSAQIKWFRKNVELRTGNYKIPIIKFKHNYYIYKEEKKSQFISTDFNTSIY